MIYVFVWQIVDEKSELSFTEMLADQMEAHRDVIHLLATGMKECGHLVKLYVKVLFLGKSYLIS